MVKIRKITKGIFLFLLAYLLVCIFSPLVFIYNIIYKLIKREDIISYIETSAIGFDQAGGSVLYQKENFTISSYTYFLCKYRNKHCKFMNFINFFFGKNHCMNSYIWETSKDTKDLNDFINI